MNGKKAKYIVDAWAWIEYFDGSVKGERVKKYVENEKDIVFTSAVTLAEVVSKFLRMHMNSDLAVNGVSTLSHVLPAEHETATLAGELHAEIKETIKDFGLADAFVLSTARKYGAKIITGDPHFKNFKEAIFLD